MPDLSCSPDDYASHDAYAHAMATIAAHDPDRDVWAIGGEDSPTTETEVRDRAQTWQLRADARQ